jgi:glutamine amidotransferase-like uncharacterized protein
MKTIFCLLALTSLSLSAQSLRPKALVYGGDGACEEECVSAAVTAAQKAGLTAYVVTPANYDKALFQDAVVWIQPGGHAVQESESMGDSMMEEVRNFVRNGGGYVGFCAGAFIATEEIGTSGVRGLGVIPGKTIVYEALGYPTIETMRIGKSSRQIYWEGGPYFILDDRDLETSEIRGYYQRTEQPSFVRASFGQGRSYVTGAHPEAPQSWRKFANLYDSDGLDYNITTEMIKWVTRVSN